ncbi:MAG TPA: hypothetical protein V6C57_08160 [Coleofasciculaceae cyanobacterium]
MLRRLPFTLMMAIGILLIAILTGTTTSTLNPTLRQQWGFALHDLWDGTWYSLVTEVLFTTDPIMLCGILIFVWLSIGIYEWRVGTRQAALLYWLTDIGGSLILSLVLVLPLYLADTSLGIKLAYADDVGMSGGGFGCVGAWVHRLSYGKRKWVFINILGYLLVHLIFFTSIFDDSLHLFSYIAGFCLDQPLSHQKIHQHT